MNVPPTLGPVTVSSDNDVLHWLTNDTRDERFIDNIFAELCIRLQRAGIPVKRATLHIIIHHPQWLGARFMWADGMREAEIKRVDYDVRRRSEYIGSQPTRFRTEPQRYARISNAIPRWAASTLSMKRCGRTA